MESEEEYNNKAIFDNLNQEEDDRYINGLDSFKLTRRQKRSIFKNQKMSNRIKQLTNVKYV